MGLRWDFLGFSLFCSLVITNFVRAIPYKDLDIRCHLGEGGISAINKSVVNSYFSPSPYITSASRAGNLPLRM